MRDFQHIFGGDATGDAHVLGVSAVVEEQVLAEIFLSATAMKTTQARGGIGGHHAHADLPAGIYALSDGGNFADHFVAKDGRRLNHFGVITALPNFEVGAIGQREEHADQNFIDSQRGHIDLLNTQVFATVENGGIHFDGDGHPGRSGFHGCTDLRFSCSRRSHWWVISILSDSTVGRAASSNPSWILASGKRCVTIFITGSCFFNIKSAAVSWMSAAAL